MLSMSDLVSEIESIRREKPKFNFDFDDWSQELNDIHYQYNCQKMVCQNFYYGLIEIDISHFLKKNKNGKRFLKLIVIFII